MGVREYARILRPANIRRSWSSAWNACCAVFVGQFYPNSLRAQQATVEALAVALERLAGVEKQSATISQAFAAALASQAESSRQIALLARRLEETVTLIREETVQQVGEARRETSALLQATQSALGGQTERAVTGLRAHLDEALALARSETSGLMEATQSALGGQTERAVTGLRAHLDEALALGRQESESHLSATRQALSDQLLPQGVMLRDLGAEVHETKKQLARCRRYTAISEDQLTGQNSPEEALICGFLPLLGSRTAIDIGAHTGSFTKFLFSAGFAEVFAFEPHPGLGKKLKGLLSEYPSLHLGEFAVGDRDGEAKLHLAQRRGKSRGSEDLLLLSSLKKHPMPEELSFGSTVDVQVRSLRSLLKEGLLPARAGLFKTDTEGFDATIVSQFSGESDYDVVLTEFWSNSFIFADKQDGERKDCTMILREKGYPCSLAIIRTLDGQLSFSANKSPAGLHVPSWGNVFHFKQPEIFRTAYQMLQNMLPEDF